MSSGSTYTVIIDINHKLDGLPSTPSRSCIRRVESHFRCVGSDDIYEPQILSIGPYHHGNPKFQYMQQLKYIYLKRLLERRKERVHRYVNAVEHMKKRARQCYKEPIDLDENRFMTLLVLDGIFLVEFFRYYDCESLRVKDDPIFSDENLKDQLHHDILLLENQLPLFVLHELFNMTGNNDGVVSGEKGFIDLDLENNDGVVSGEKGFMENNDGVVSGEKGFIDLDLENNDGVVSDEKGFMENNDGVVSGEKGFMENNDGEKGFIDLALGFVRHNVLFNLPVSPVWDDKNAADHLLGLMYDSLCRSFAEEISPKLQKSNDFEKLINSVSGLKEAGVKFEVGNDHNEMNVNVMDVKFVKGVLIIPRLNIGDEVESQLKNLIVHEQYLPERKPRYVSDYSFFMSCLIKTSNDVELLCNHGIILNFLGSSEQICQMFNRLGRNTMISSGFCYSHVFRSLNVHCGHRRNRWKANLRKNYFSSPWSIISFLAAAVLLIFTIAQTAYTVLAFYYR